MKAAFIFVVCFVAASYATYDEEVDLMKKMQAECETKLGEPKNFIEKLRKNEYMGDMDKAMKMALCINVKMGTMDETGTVMKDKMKEHVEKLTDEAKRRTIMEDTCGNMDMTGKTPEAAAMDFSRCMMKYMHMPIDQ